MVVVDSSGLIPLAKTGWLKLIRDNFNEIITTDHIYNETVVQGKGMEGTSEIKKAFDGWIEIEKVDIIYSKELADIEGIAVADASLLILAEKRKDILLSNDRALILAGRAKNIECYWITSLLLKSLKEGMINRNEAKDILFDLVDAGMNLRNSVFARLLKVIDKWS